MSWSLLLLAAAAPAAAPAPNPDCLPKRMTIDRQAPVAGPKRLNELPPAEHYLAVYHRRDGCMVPIKARERR